MARCPLRRSAPSGALHRATDGALAGAALRRADSQDLAAIAAAYDALHEGRAVLALEPTGALPERLLAAGARQRAAGGG